MKLVVGLGNPGREYVGTRHNIGFNLLDYIASRKKLEFKNEKFNGVFTSMNVGDEKIILLKPLSYMNLSGGVVAKYASFYKIKPEDILIIQDDLDMNIGRIKIVRNSSSGGHNGIKDIERCLSSKMYTRVKIGISNNKSMDTKDYVLGKFNQEELAILDKNYEILSEVIEDFCSLSMDRLMNKYNRK